MSDEGKRILAISAIIRLEQRRRELLEELQRINTSIKQAKAVLKK